MTKARDGRDPRAPAPQREGPRAGEQVLGHPGAHQAAELLHVVVVVRGPRRIAAHVRQARGVERGERRPLEAVLGQAGVEEPAAGRDAPARRCPAAGR